MYCNALSRVRLPIRFRFGIALTAIGLVFVSVGVKASTTYSYDAVGRVTTAAYDTGVCVAYGYDANGNRTSQTNTSTSGPVTPTWGTGSFGCFLWSP